MTNTEEYFEILLALEQHHALFSRFWSIGHLMEDDKLNPPTACVTFDKYGNGLMFRVHPTFWASLTIKEKVFVLAHECLHIYLEHGRRMKNLKPRQIANIAADVVVNHYLEDAFGFNRKDIRGWQRYCWMETVFPNDPTVLRQKSLEYYFALLTKRLEEEKKKQQSQGGSGQDDGVGDQQTIDEHAEMPEITEEEIEQILSKISKEEMEQFEELINRNNPDEIKSAQQAGKTAGHMMQRIRLLNIVKKRKWETIIKNVTGRFIGKERDIIVEQWAHKNRRLASIDSGELMLPSDIDEVEPIRDRIDVWFFQDTSGSCKHLAERFFKAAASLPDDRFRARLFCFDTQVYETSIKSGKLYGFGGTAFDVIENHIQQTIRLEANKRTKYPSIVFIVTDGHGNDVKPEFPERWHWFLSEGNTTAYIPKKSKFYDLKNFE